MLSLCFANKVTNLKHFLIKSYRNETFVLYLFYNYNEVII